MSRADPAAATIPLLQTPGSAPEIDHPRATARWLDGVLAAVVLVFAGLTAATAVRNSDLWLHLATGRHIVQAPSPFGAEPFLHTTAGVRWVNHSWLFDVCVHQVHRTFGDAGLVPLKIALVVAVVGVMLTVRRRGQSLLFPAVGVMLATLAMSPRLALQPGLLSLLFLATTVSVLVNAAEFPRRLWLLPPLFALWANCDAWFLLGPVALLVYLPNQRSSREHLRRTVAVLLVGLAACLVNPYHVHVFELPPELSPAVLNSGLSDDVRFQRLFDTPWRWSRYDSTADGLNAAGLAYFVLLAAGVVSFATNRAALRDWRLPLWVAFALLGAWQLRLVPIFAVVAGPITALNLQDATLPRPRAGLRFLAALAGCGLALLTWPGWLQATPHDAGRVSLAVHPEPSLWLAGQTLRDWLDRGLLTPDDRVFVTHPAAGPYLAWHCPELKGSLDTRLALLSAPLVADHLAVSRGLNHTPGDRPDREWVRILRDRGITLIVLHDASTVRNVSALGGPILDDPGHWPLLFLSGKSLIVGRRDDGRPDVATRLDRLRLAPDRLAYGTRLDLHRAEAPVPTGTDSILPAPPEPDQAFRRQAPPPGWEADAATAWLRYFDEVNLRRQPGVARAAFACTIADIVAAPAGRDHATGTAQTLVRFAPFWPSPDLESAPPEAALLAIRAARRAVEQNPNDAGAWQWLGQAYVALSRRTTEARLAQQLPTLGILRHAQIAAALENAVLLDPNLQAAHHTLATLYLTRNYVDLAVEHVRDEVRLAQRAGATPGESPEAATARLRQLDERAQDLEKLLQDRKNQYAIQSPAAGDNALARAQLARRLGLVVTALDTLQKSKLVLFGVEGARLQLELQVTTGRLDRARESLLDPDLADHRELLGQVQIPAAPLPGYKPAVHLPAYEWFILVLSAATGHYSRVHEELHVLDDRLSRAAFLSHDRLTQQLAATAAADVGAAIIPGMGYYRAFLRDREFGLARVREDVIHLRLVRSDLKLLTGLLALEAGRPDRARPQFERAAEFGAAVGPNQPTSASLTAAKTLLARMAAAE